MGNAMAATGGGSVKSVTDPTKGKPDFEIFANQILTEDGGGISGYLYLGQAGLPTSISNPDSAFFKNKFTRWALFASYPPISQWMIDVGYEQGKDNTWNSTSWSYGDDFTSKGWFGQLAYSPSDLLAIGARYDQFIPSTMLSDNALSAISVFCNYCFDNGIHVIGEYRTQDTQMGPGLKQTDGYVQLHVVVIQ